MADTRVSDLVELAETPHASDLVPLVDVSDTTQAATGSTKKVTRANLVGGLATTAVLSANGKGFVNHGATAGTARPTGFASIEWCGSVEPTNAVNGDTWVNTTV